MAGTDYSVPANPRTGTIFYDGVEVNAAHPLPVSGIAGSGQSTSANSMSVVQASDPDLRPTAGNITIQDTGSSSTTGQNSASIVTGTPTAASFRSQAINGHSSVRVQVSGTWTGTLQAELSADAGTTWVPVPLRVTGTVYTGSTMTANGTLYGDVSGATNFRVRATAAMTGTAVVQMDFSAASGAVQVLNPVRLADNTSGAQATIKAASTPAALTDTSLVTASLPSGYDVAVTITRPANATPYTANDVLGGALTFALMGPSAGAIMITSAELEADVAAVPTGMTSFRLYLYSVTPPGAVADNGAWDLPAGDRASFLGYIDIGVPVDLGSTLYVRADAINAQFRLAGTSLFGYLVTNGGFTPAGNSEVYKLTLHAVAL